MKNKELYQSTFSQLHTSVQVKPEDYQTVKRHPNVLRMLAAVAAAAVLLAAMTATALAFNLFGLRDLAFPERTTLHIPNVEPDTGDITWEDRVVDMISMQGYADAPEARACMEWQRFYQEYTEAHSFDNSIYDEGGRYSLYGVFDDTMAAKLDEIAEKYGLKLHESMADIEDRDSCLEMIGPTFLVENNTCYWGYRYEDGTAAFDGAAELDGCGLIDYQLRYARRGYFDEVALNVGNLTDYAEWDYTAANGVPLKLALGTNRSFIWADLGEGFLFVNVLTGSQGNDTFSQGAAIDRKGLERLAESFDFTALRSDDPRREDISHVPPDKGPEG